MYFRFLTAKAGINPLSHIDPLRSINLTQFIQWFGLLFRPNISRNFFTSFEESHMTHIKFQIGRPIGCVDISKTIWFSPPFCFSTQETLSSWDLYAYMFSIHAIVQTAMPQTYYNVVYSIPRPCVLFWKWSFFYYICCECHALSCQKNNPALVCSSRLWIVFSLVAYVFVGGVSKTLGEKEWSIALKTC